MINNLHLTKENIYITLHKSKIEVAFFFYRRSNNLVIMVMRGSSIGHEIHRQNEIHYPIIF